VRAVRRNAGPAALSGLGRATAVGIVAAGTAALAGWGVVSGIGHVAGSGPSVGASLVQGVLGGVAVLAVFLGVAYALDRRDVAAVTARLRRRGGERSGGRE
jgi:putative peptidoglycan lipid II flippase